MDVTAIRPATRARIVLALVATTYICLSRPAPAQAPDSPAVTTLHPALRTRSFTLKYQAFVKDAPPGRLDVWMPVPPATPGQSIADLTVDTTLAHEFVTEAAYGGTVLHAWADDGGAHGHPVAITLSFRATRSEQRAADTRAKNLSPPPAPRDVQPDRLGVIDDRIRNLAAEITAGKLDPTDKARAIYDYVVAHMAYDKVAPGWGNGDTARACTVGKGNCTDFHALFMSLARASGIPARFQIGFQLPTDRKAGAVEGYHCWSEFWTPGQGWVPVDCSEGWKHPQQRAFYFGALDADRVAMSIGRDLRLPGAKGEPVNYLLAPYVEVEGKPLTAGVGRVVTFEEK